MSDDTDAPDKAAQRASDFDALFARLERGAPELLPFARDLEAAVKPGEWNAVVARLLGNALHRAGRAEGREGDAFRVAIGHLTYTIAEGFIGRTGRRPLSAFNASHDAMVIEAADAKNMPDAVAALAKWDAGADGEAVPAKLAEGHYAHLKRRATAAAKVAGLDLAPGEPFRGATE